MAIVLGQNQYGKAGIRLMRVHRDTPRHEIRDLLVATSLRGEFEAAHVTGDQAAVLPTDSQKNAAFAHAREHGVGQIEDYALRLARYFKGEVDAVNSARVDVEEYAWDRIEVDGRGHDHAFVRSGREVRTATAVIEAGDRVHVESGLKDLTVLKSTGSQFRGFGRDRYTTLEETGDRIMATSLEARWRYVGDGLDWGVLYAGIRARLLERFANVHSLALQHSLWEMGRAALEAHPEVAEIRLAAPNKHHFLVDLAPFELDNPGQVFYAADRPYGLIEASVRRDEAPPGPDWG